MKMNADLRRLARAASLALWLVAAGKQAAATDFCEFAPGTHAVTLIRGEPGSGGIGGTGAPPRTAGSSTVVQGKGGIGDALRESQATATGSGGIGGAGKALRESQAAATGSGGIGGTGKALRASQVAATGSGGIGGTGAAVRPALAGSVLFAHGTVLAQRADGFSRTLNAGDPVCTGDAIETRQASLAQLTMADGGQIGIRAESRLQLDAFVLPSTMDGSERFSATLDWGSIRATTGEIGHLHKALYALHTPVTDIGIRGTVHEVFHIPNPLPGVPAGTYNRVLSGGTVLLGAGQRLELAPQEIGFVPAIGRAPMRLPHLPSALVKMTTPAWSSGNKNTVAPVDDTEAATYLKPLQSIDKNFDLSTVAPEGSAYVGVSQDIGNSILVAGGAISRKRNGSLIVLDPDWGIPVAAADTHNGFNFQSQDNSPLYDLGYATVDGIDVIWGLYGATAVVDPNSGAVKSYDFHHFAYADQGATPRSVLSSLSGTATFGQLIGGTMLSDESGGIGGQVNSLSIGVRFGGNAAITSYQINATDAQSRTWDAQFNGAISLSAFRAGKMALTGTCQGEGCGSGSATGTASGIIIGNNGKGIITSYGLQTGSGQSAAGAAVVARP
ncbi:FecR family protein [Paludibacterium yongneupense]|uniref:FecR family protein n=1 Tax=Paludibacterium yongneupense TaxID=400061 RepID=UPI00041332B3|nr:hypothetical protein [Paludibacterium yongneupense]